MGVHPYGRLITSMITTLYYFNNFFMFFLYLRRLLFRNFRDLSYLNCRYTRRFFIRNARTPSSRSNFYFRIIRFFLLIFRIFLSFLSFLLSTNNVINLSQFRRLLPKGLPRLYRSLPGGFFRSKVRLRGAVTKLPVTIAQVPGLVGTTVPQPSFFRHVPVNMNIYPSTTNRTRTITTIATMGRPNRRNFKANTR